jgi:hypothetical protein
VFEVKVEASVEPVVGGKKKAGKKSTQKVEEKVEVCMYI